MYQVRDNTILRTVRLPSLLNVSGVGSSYAETKPPSTAASQIPTRPIVVFTGIGRLLSGIPTTLLLLAAQLKVTLTRPTVYISSRLSVCVGMVCLYK